MEDNGVDLSGTSPANAVPEPDPRTEEAKSAWAGFSEALPVPKLPKTPPASQRGARLPLDTRIELLALFCLDQWLKQGQAATAGDAITKISAFKTTYERPNAAGTLLGRGVAGHGFDLRVRSGNAYSACYENAWCVIKRLTPDQLARVASQPGFARPAALADALNALPRFTAEGAIEPAPGAGLPFSA